MGAQQPTWPLDVFGIYFTIISILVVFQILELQLWVESVNQYLYAFEHSGSLSGTAYRKAREDWRRRGKRLRTRYPSWIAYGLYVLQIGLFVLGLLIDVWWLLDVPCLYTTVPLVGYLVLVLGGPIALVIRSRRSVDEVIRKLDDLETT